MSLTFNTLLRQVGFDPFDVRVVRHLDTRKTAKLTPYALWRTDLDTFEYYQRVQGLKKFTVGTYLASFVITPSNETLFVGMFHIDSLGIAPEGSICPIQQIDVSGLNLYDISRVPQMNDLIGRVVIDWGPGARSWVQFANRREKNVLEIRRRFEEEPFPGYFLFRCKLSDLSSLPETWKARLIHARGVYVLTSVSTNAQYVGSAAGNGGFFGRWSQHAAAGGDAVAFKSLVPSEYQVAILQVATGFETDSDILRIEYAWMDKLQSRSMGLNGTPAHSEPPISP